MTMMLASVQNLDEALLVLESGVDLIDLKAPSAGALGALPTKEVRRIVSAVAGRRPVSATVGDLPMEPATVLEAGRAMAATGVDYVKVGFFPDGDWFGCIDACSGLATSGTRLVAVLFGDQSPDLAVLPTLASNGFAGVMLDTMDKSAGPLTACCGARFLREFVRLSRDLGLLTGLAGSLREADIDPLLELEPGYLGFRGGLCVNAQRSSALDPRRVESLLKRLRSSACMA
ncbi:MAG: hypothetical protein FIA97_10690 [Methylococcaceae bacterium]|nr:hypothetical protein [Methylococcaceae bacterium]